MSQVQADLLEHKTIILSLIPYANNTKLDALIRKLTEGVKESVRFLIKMEIKRLSQPCFRVVDLRSMFSDCEKVHYQNLCHYLDSEAKSFFYEAVEKNNGTYSIHLYEKLMSNARERYSLNMAKCESKSPDSYDCRNEKQRNSIEVVPLVTEIEPNLQACSVSSQLRLFYRDVSSCKNPESFLISSSCLDIILIKDGNIVFDVESSPFHDIANECYIMFNNHSRELGISDDITICVSVHSYQEYTKKGEKLTRYYLKVIPSKSKQEQIALYKQFVIKYNRALKEFKRNHIPSLVGSIMAKSHEQFVINATTDIPVLIAKYSENWRPTVLLETASNKGSISIFSENGSGNKFEQLFLDPWIQKQYDSSSNFSRFGLLVKHDNKSYVYWLDEMLKTKASFEKAAFFTKNFNCIAFEINNKKIDALSDSSMPKSIPEKVSSTFDMVNIPISKEAKRILLACRFMSTLRIRDDLTGLFTYFLEKEASSTFNLDKKIPPLPLYKKKSSLHFVKAREKDDRSEDRFAFNFEIKITKVNDNKVDFLCRTENISAKGLKIRGIESELKSGDVVEISIDMSPVGGGMIHKQSYLVLGGGKDVGFRLVVNTNPKKHKASKMIKRFISQNIVKLDATGYENNLSYQLSHFMRCIYTHNIQSVPFYVQQNKMDWYVNAVSISPRYEVPMYSLPNVNQETSFKSFLSEDSFREQCGHYLKVADRNRDNEVSFFVLVGQKKYGEEITYWVSNAANLLANKQFDLLFDQFYKGEGKVSVLRISISKSKSKMQKYFKDELRYLESIDSSIAGDLKSIIGNIDFIGSVTDVTSILTQLHKVNYSD